MSVFDELKRRNVFRVAAAYAVVGWLIVEIATTLLQTFGAPDWVARAFVIAVALGFVPAVIVAWAYELTPDGIRRESQVDRQASITRETGRKLDLVTIAAVIIGVGFLGLSRFIGPPSPASSESTVATTVDASVAVLPFVNMSDSDENEYFSDGLTETLLHMLAQVPELKVAARTSSFAFKGRQQDVREIASALRVAHVLEGSVQRSGDRVRITAQLIRADDGFHVWSESYDRTLSDIFTIQDEIATSVSGALTHSLLGGDVVAIVSIDTENIGAYDAYLRALSDIATHSYASLASAEQQLKQALALDPGFSDAKIGLAHVYMRQANTGMLPIDEAWRRAGALLDEVIADHPDNYEAQAHALINDIEYHVQTGNSLAEVEAIPALREILSKSPANQPARVQLARTLAMFKQPDESEEHFRILLETDALNPQLHWLRGDAMLNAGRIDDALAAFQRSAELEPDNPNAWARIGDVRRRQGDAVGFVDNYQRAVDKDPQDSELASMLANYLFLFGLIEHGDEYLNRAAAIAPSHQMTAISRMLRHRSLGDTDAALEVARFVIADDGESRHRSFAQAVAAFVDLSLARGEAESAYLFLENNVPGINRPDRTDLPLKVVIAQSTMFPLWYAALPDDQAEEKIADWERSLQIAGFDASDQPYDYVDILALRGDTAGAADIVLESLLSRPPARFADWQHYFSRRPLAKVVADPRVASELDRYAAETDRLRESLLAHFASRSP